MPTLVITRGNDRTFRVTAVDYLGAPADLTDAHLWFTAKFSPADTDEDAAIRKSSTDGVEVTAPPTGGIASVTINAADTVDLGDAKGRRGLVLFWDLKVKDLDDLLTTLAKGLLIVEGDITRATTP